ncbi:MAG: Ig-like domain-containing protein [Prosthecobacter sp.]|uniref:Ig-like domain-containing protein n=1 Tax=Prosthecobacter sp. TaxID=1965333 RepID=UPI0039022B44
MTLPSCLHRLGWLVLSGTLCLTQAAELRVNEVGQIEVQGGDVRVFRGDAATPMFGTVSKERDAVRFAPALPFVPGERYRVEFQKTDGSWSTQRLRIELPKAEAPTAAMLPSDTPFPANALKFYLHFSQPMEQGVFLDRISLHRLDGSVVQGAFRETELWSPDGKRLTLWLHPGRQKTGVNLNTDEGPVLQEGETYTLKLAANWRSAAGVPLGQKYTFWITAGAVDHACPEPQRWKVTAPKRSTRDPLHLLFDEALDPAMLNSALHVRSGDQAVKGVIHVATDARSWSLIPAAEWPPGRYEIVIDPLLEDLAGNNLLGPFEVDRDQPAQPAQVTLLRFEIGE